MIPVFFRTYHKAPLATFISLLSTGCYILTAFFTLGYLLNWEDLRDEVPLGTCLLIAAVSAVVGFALGKLAEFLAARKAASAAAAAREASPLSASPTAQSAAAPGASDAPRPENRFCTGCGAAVRPGDAFCRNCGKKLSAPSTAAPSAPPKNRKAMGILLALTIVALAYGGGKLLGGRAARNTTQAPTAAPSAPALLTPLSTPSPAPTPLPLSTPSPEQTAPADTSLPAAAAAKEPVWDYLDATDDEIRALTYYFWGGTDQATGANCAFFADQNAARGGYIWWKSDGEGMSASFEIGTLTVDSRDRDILVSAEGETVLYVDPYGDGSDGSILFNFGEGVYISGRMRLYEDRTLEEPALRIILAYKKAQSAFRGVG